jgi:ATP-dependent Lhr-like helicase
LTARYPIDPAHATELLERWEAAEELVRLEPGDEGGHTRWGDQRNLDEVRRLSIALRRRESVAVPPEVFADFVARRQHVHQATRQEGQAATLQVLDQLQGFAAPASLWESDFLPRRVCDYRPVWLDDALTTGGWLWRAQGEIRGEPRVAFALRDFAGAWPLAEGADPLAEDEVRVLDHLTNRGACFASDLARGTGLEPSRVRSALLGLLRCGLVSNDRFDPVRPGGQALAGALLQASAAAPERRVVLGRPGGSLRRLASAAAKPEGRWSHLEAGGADPETAHLAWAIVLLSRYGILAREMVALDAWAPPWRDLAPWLARAELRGELRRGYFVEGLSGVQYASAEAAEELARQAAAPRNADRPEPTLISTLDPANLYGAGAPLDIPLLEGGTARLPRSAANFLALCDGRPVLIIESYGRRLTGLASASQTELHAALALLLSLAGPARRVLKVETYNTAAAWASPVAPCLAELGFVRDYPGMTYYAGW